MEEARARKKRRERALVLTFVMLSLPLGIGAYFVALNKQHLPEFSMHALLELSMAFFSFAAITLIVNWLYKRIRDPLGVEDVYPSWIMDRPRTTIRDEFIAASEVEIIGVSVYNSLIDEEWFEAELLTRLNANRPTRFLLVAKDGDEIKRRNLEPREPEPPKRLSVLERNTLSHEAIERVHGQSGRGDLDKVLRSFDYSPGVNYLRFGNVGYIVFVSDRGGFSPALKVRHDSVLYQHYRDTFKFIWKQNEPGKMTEPRIPIQLKSDEPGRDHGPVATPTIDA